MDHFEEQASPELALVDEELAARLRARALADDRSAELEREHPPAIIVHLEPPVAPRPVLVPLYGTPPAVALAAPQMPEEVTVGPIRLAPHESEASEYPPALVSFAPTARRPVPSVHRRAELRRSVTAFVAGAVVATVVAVGVFAQMSELTPIVLRPPAGEELPQSSTPSAPSSPPVASTSKTPAATTPVPSTTAAAPVRFSWAPVAGAVGYRVELFRGARRVLSVRTSKPVLRLERRWRHKGRIERFLSGTYRWTVRPVLASGLGSDVAVESRIVVP